MYCLAELMEFAAFVWLRISAPELHRPYRVPLPTWGCALMLLPASVLLITIIVMPIYSLDWLVSAPRRACIHLCMCLCMCMRSGACALKHCGDRDSNGVGLEQLACHLLHLCSFNRQTRRVLFVFFAVKMCVQPQCMLPKPLKGLPHDRRLHSLNFTWIEAFCAQSDTHSVNDNLCSANLIRHFHCR